MVTDFEYKKQKLRGRLEELVGRVSEKDKTGRQWICPVCKSGSGSYRDFSFN
ncbi:MAG: hypothetical protein LBU35_01935 [Holosporales bacterium]|nr:hypothetical protein [Holosporales bacterium]